MKRIIFKKGIKTILIPALAPFELTDIIDKQLSEFYKKYKINEKASMHIEYNSNDNLFIFVVEKQSKKL